MWFKYRLKVQKLLAQGIWCLSGCSVFSIQFFSLLLPSSV